jgi:hypothetical protein
MVLKYTNIKIKFTGSPATTINFPSQRTEICECADRGKMTDALVSWKFCSDCKHVALAGRAVVGTVVEY